MEPEAEYTNHLIDEKSPYLLQHAHNPVDWYPWGEAAFAKAKERDVPIFLSIGYAACHWCHVMEEEAFSDPECAKILNETFVCIKVDREEQPQIDSLYMEFAQTMIVGAAGWPLNLILTPNLKPFFAATYLSKRSSQGMIGLIELTEKLSQLWKSDERERILLQSEKIVEMMKAQVHVSGTEIPRQEIIQETAEILFKIADPIYGGMRGAPKFPLGYQEIFLSRYFLKSQDTRAIFLVELTLEMMWRGGIFDHLGGGFSRYSVDEKWHVPHFEKMLYDNAILASSYLEAWKVTGRGHYKTICTHVLQYLLRDMRDSNGGFYSAEDADSSGQEGRFYTWTKEEIFSILSIDDARLFCELHGVTEMGNFEGRSVLFMPYSLEEFAQIKGLAIEDVEKFEAGCKYKLWMNRNKRPRPSKDDKIITAWNGLVISSLAQCGFAFNNTEYLQAACQAALFIKEYLFKNGILLRRYRDKEARFRGGLDDYAFYISSLLSLFEAGVGTQWLEFALDLTNFLEKNFKAENGAFFSTDGEEQNLLVRKCHFADGAEPSGNAVHAENLVRLYQITQNKHFLAQAEDIFKAVRKLINAYPLGYCYHLLALQRYWDKKKATAVVSYGNSEGLETEIRQALAKKTLPHHAVIFRSEGDKNLCSQLPYLEAMKPLSGKTTLYICHEGVCSKPATGLNDCLNAIYEMGK